MQNMHFVFFILSHKMQHFSENNY